MDAYNATMASLVEFSILNQPLVLQREERCTDPRLWVNLIFPVTGTWMPADHGYGLYSALCHWHPIVKNLGDWQLITVNGIPSENGTIQLGDRSTMTIRTPSRNFHVFRQLSNLKFTVGRHPIQFGQFSLEQLTGVETLRSRIVVIKQQEDHFRDRRDFYDVLQRSMGRIGVWGRVKIGARRTIKIRRYNIVGYEVTITDLTPRSSLSLQMQGLGGKRRLGCGVFSAPCS